MFSLAAACNTAGTCIGRHKADTAEADVCHLTLAAKPLKRVCPVEDRTSAVLSYCSRAGLQGALHPTRSSMHEGAEALRKTWGKAGQYWLGSLRWGARRGGLRKGGAGEAGGGRNAGGGPDAREEGLGR